MNAPLRAVLFDYGHTLIYYERPEVALLAAYKTVNEILMQQVAAEVPTAEELVRGVSVEVDEEIARDYSTERLEEVEIASLYDACLRRLGLELAPDLIERIMEVEQRAWLHGVRVGPDVFSTLQRLRAAGLRLGLVSNAAYLPRLMRAQLEHLGLLPYFDTVTWSSEIGFRKPHPAMFAEALRRLGAAAEAALFVGDRIKEDIRGPQSVGMRAVLLHEWRHEEDVQGIADFTISRLAELWPLLAKLRQASEAPRPSYN